MTLVLLSLVGLGAGTVSVTPCPAPHAIPSMSRVPGRKDAIAWALRWIK